MDNDNSRRASCGVVFGVRSRRFALRFLYETWLGWVISLPCKPATTKHRVGMFTGTSV